MEPLTPEQQERLAEVWRLRMEGIKAAKKLRNDDAEAFYWQALRLHEEVIGRDDSSIADSLCALVHEFGRHGHHAEAEPLIDRSSPCCANNPSRSIGAFYGLWMANRYLPGAWAVR